MCGLTVTDVARAIAFYRDVLGMKLLFQVPNLGFFDCGGIRLMLSGSEKPDEHYGSVIYFKVPDIQEAHAALSERGAAFEGAPHLVARMPDHELWMAFFRRSRPQSAGLDERSAGGVIPYLAGRSNSSSSAERRGAAGNAASEAQRIVGGRELADLAPHRRGGESNT